ncbi:hypothetical protein Q31b_45210 [Novipirellula aureliae]|uniref:Transmembrane protein n=1 Tax=Novipirellula aureliae TaxID=2527966 RepID=A0A5C6DM75_9BACT|nr:hypothetical protein [Novipirellula aureliae]TWU37732.1 hypothetical protein Q31b_45210 [Novipirellula aureliae]
MTQNEMFADARRSMVLLVAVVMLFSSTAAWWWGESSFANFSSAALGRMGLVMGAIWIAWPSLRRPAAWFPAAVPVIGIVALMILAAQPRLIFAVLPAAGMLMALTVVVKVFRRK